MREQWKRLRERAAAMLRWLNINFMDPLRAAWYPALIAVLTLYALAAPGLASDQIHEALYDYERGTLGVDWSFNWANAGATFLALMLFTSTLRYWTARLLGLDLHNARSETLNGTKRLLWHAIWLAPWAATALAFARVGADMLQSGIAISVPYVACALSAIALPAIDHFAWRRSNLYERTRGDARYQRATRWLLPAIFVIGVVTFSQNGSGNIHSQHFPSVDSAQTLGLLALLFTALAVYTAMGATLLLLGRRARLPFFGLFVLAAAFISFADLNDNHPLHSAPAPLRDDPRSATPVDQAFNDWRQTRTPHTSQQPIIIVSAEGGGVRAGYVTALTLARVADHCPPMARRIFAISSVSGGSVGAAIYAAMLKARPLDDADIHCDFSEPARTNGYEAATTVLFVRDHLSPVFARLLFPDTLQAFLPFPVDSFDRQLGLELSFDEAFRQIFHQPVLTTPLTNVALHVSRADTPTEPFSGRDVPYLLLNTTSVEYGDRVLASTLDTTSMSIRRLNKNTLSLGTAASASARFPYVTPSGRVNRRNIDGLPAYLPETGLRPSDRERLVDGGYFDNSGLVTATDLATALTRQVGTNPALTSTNRVYILYITNTPRCPLESAARACRERWLRHPWRGFSELLGPLRGAASAREGRADQTFRDAVASFGGVGGGRFFSIGITQSDVAIPLGWYLSARAAQEIQHQLTFSDCHDDPSLGPVEPLSNSCMLQELADDLSCTAPTRPGCER